MKVLPSIDADVTSKEPEIAPAGMLSVGTEGWAIPESNEMSVTSTSSSNVLERMA